MCNPASGQTMLQASYTWDIPEVYAGYQSLTNWNAPTGMSGADQDSGISAAKTCQAGRPR